jgi:WD40 repeat protein
MKWIITVLLLSIVPVLFLSGQSDNAGVKIFKKHSAPVKALTYSSDGDVMATGGEDKAIYFWNVKSGELTGTIKNFFNIKALQFTPDNLILAACGSDIKLMDMQGRLIRTFTGYTTDIWSMDYNAGAHKVIAGSYARSIKVWNYDNASVLFTLTGHEKSCLPVDMNAAGDMAVSGSLDKSVRLWDLKKGEQIKKLEIHSENIFAVDFHPSGKYVLSASADKTIRLWNLETGSVVRTYSGHNAGIFDVRFSPDGNCFLSCSADKTIILWETATGKILNTFTGHGAYVNEVRFSPDGNSFASASDDQTVRIWNLEKKYFVDAYFEKEIDEARQASPLFAPRKPEESKQAYTSRELEAKKFLDGLYNQYYEKYLQLPGLNDPEGIQKHE